MSEKTMISYAAMIVGMILCIAALFNWIPVAVGAGGLFVLLYGLFTIKS